MEPPVSPSATSASKSATTDLTLRADAYCYACDDAKLDPRLADHLANFGIEVAGQKKTEKTMTELVSSPRSITRRSQAKSCLIRYTASRAEPQL